MTPPPESREGAAAAPVAARRRSSDTARRRQQQQEREVQEEDAAASSPKRQLTSLLSFRYRQHLPFSGRGLATARLSAADYEAHAAQGTLAIQDQLHFEYPVAQHRSILQRLGLKHGRTARSAGSSPVRERPPCKQQSPGEVVPSTPGGGSAAEQQQPAQVVAREPRQRSQSARRPSGQCSLSPDVGISSRAASPAGSVLAAGQHRQAAGQLAALDVGRSACSSPRGGSSNPPSPAKAPAAFHIAFGRRWPIELAATEIEPATSSGSSGSRRSTRSPSRTRDAHSGPGSMRRTSPAAGAPRDGSRVHSGVCVSSSSSRSSTQDGLGEAVRGRGGSAGKSTRNSMTESTFCAATPVAASSNDAGSSRPSAIVESPPPAAVPGVAEATEDAEDHASAAAAGSSPGSFASRGGAMWLLKRVLSPNKSRGLDEVSSAPASPAGSPAASASPAQQADGGSIRRWLLRASGAGSQRTSLNSVAGAPAPAAAAAEPPASAAASAAAEAGAMSWPDAAVLQSHPLSLSPGWEQSSGSTGSPLVEHPIFIQKVATHNPEGADLLSPRASSPMPGSPRLAQSPHYCSPRTLSWGRASLLAHLAPSAATRPLPHPLPPKAEPAAEQVQQHEQRAGSTKDAVQGHALLQQLLAATPTDSEAESRATSPAAARTYASVTTVDAAPATAAWSEFDHGMPALHVRTSASKRSSQHTAEPGSPTTYDGRLSGLGAESTPAAAVGASASGALSSPGMSEPGCGRAGSTANASDLSACNSDGEEYDEHHARTGVRRYSSAAGASQRRSRGRTHSTVVNWDSLERHARGSDEASDAHRSRSPSSLGGVGLKPLVSPAQYSATAAAAAAGASILAAVAPAMAGSLPQLEAAAVAAVAAVAARACSMEGSPGGSLRASLPGFEGQSVPRASLASSLLLEDSAAAGAPLDPVCQHAPVPTSAKQSCEAPGALRATCLMHGDGALAADGSGGAADEDNSELQPIMCQQDSAGPHERLQADSHLPGGAELRGRRHGRAAGAASHQVVRATLDLPNGTGLSSVSASCELHQLEEETWQQQLQRVAAECQAAAAEGQQQTEEFHSCGGESAVDVAGGDTRRSSQAPDGSEGGRELPGAAADANDDECMLPRTASGSDISAELRRATAEVMAEIERVQMLREQAAVAAAWGVQLTRLSTSSGSEFYSAQEHHVHSSGVSPSASCGSDPLPLAAADAALEQQPSSRPSHGSTGLSELSDDVYDFCQEMRVQVRERQGLLRVQQHLEDNMVQLQEAMAAATVPPAEAEPTEAEAAVSKAGKAAPTAHTPAITCEPEAAAADMQAGVTEAGAAVKGAMLAAGEVPAAASVPADATVAEPAAVTEAASAVSAGLAAADAKGTAAELTAAAAVTTAVEARASAEEAADEALLVGSAGEEEAVAAAQTEAAADSAELTPTAQASEAASSSTAVSAPAIEAAMKLAGAAAADEAPGLAAAAAAAGPLLAASTAVASTLPEETVDEEAVPAVAGVDSVAPEATAGAASGNADAAVLAVSPPEAAEESELLLSSAQGEQAVEEAPPAAASTMPAAQDAAALDAAVTAAATTADAADAVEPAAAAAAEAQPDGALAASPLTMAAEQALAAAANTSGTVLPPALPSAQAEQAGDAAPAQQQQSQGITLHSSSTPVRSYAGALAAGAPPRLVPACSKDEQHADEQRLKQQGGLAATAGESPASCQPELVTAGPERAAGWGASSLAAAADATAIAAAASAGSGQQPSVAAMAMALPTFSLTVEVPVAAAAAPGFAVTPASSWGGCSTASTPASWLARSYAAAAAGSSSGGGATPGRATTPGRTTPRRVADPELTNNQERHQQPGWKAKLQRLASPHASGGGAGGGLISHASLVSDEPGSPWRIPAAAGEPQAASGTGSAPSSRGGAGSSGGGSNSSSSSGQQQQPSTQGDAGIKSSSSRRRSHRRSPSPVARTHSTAAAAASLVPRRLSSHDSILAHTAPAAAHVDAPAAAAAAAAGDSSVTVSDSASAAAAGDGSSTNSVAAAGSQEAGSNAAPADAAPKAAEGAAPAQPQQARAGAAKAVSRAPAKGSSNASRPTKQTSKASRKAAAAAAAAAANRAPTAAAVAVARPGFWQQLLAVAAAWWQQVTVLALALLLAGAVYHARSLTLLAKHAPTQDQVRAALQGLPDAFRATAAKQAHVSHQQQQVEVPAWHLQQLEAQVDEAMVAQRGSSWHAAACDGEAAAAGKGLAASVLEHQQQLLLNEPHAAPGCGKDAAAVNLEEELQAAAAGHGGPGKEPALPQVDTRLQQQQQPAGEEQVAAAGDEDASLLQDDAESSASKQLLQHVPEEAEEVQAADGQLPVAADQPAVTAEQQQPDGEATAAEVDDEVAHLPGDAATDDAVHSQQQKTVEEAEAAAALSTADVVPAEQPAHAAEFDFDYDEDEADTQEQQPQQQGQKQLASLLDKFMGLLQSKPVGLDGADEDVALMLHMEQRESQQLAQLREQARDADSQQQVVEAEASAPAAAAAGSTQQQQQQQQPEEQEPEAASGAASKQQPEAAGTATTPTDEAEEEEGLHEDSWLLMEPQHQEEAAAAAAADDSDDGLGALAELLAQQQQQPQAQQAKPSSCKGTWEQEEPPPEQTASLLKGPLSKLLSYWRRPAEHHNMGHPQHGDIDTQRLGLFGQLLSQVHLDAEADAELLAFLQQQQQQGGVGLEDGSYEQLPQREPPSNAAEAPLEFEEEATAAAAGGAATDAQQQQQAGSNKSQAAGVSAESKAGQEEQQAPQEEDAAAVQELELQAAEAGTRPLAQAEQLNGVAATDAAAGAGSPASQEQPTAAGNESSMGTTTLLAAAATAGVAAAAVAGLLLQAWRLAAAAAAAAQDQEERPDIDSDGYEGDAAGEEWGHDAAGAAGGGLDVYGASDDEADDSYDAAADSDNDASVDDVSLVASDASDSLPAAPGSTARSRGTAAAAAAAGAATAAVQTAAATGRRLLQAAAGMRAGAALVRSVAVARVRRGRAAAGHEVAAASTDHTWLRPNNMVRRPLQQQAQGGAGLSPASVDRRWLRNRVITQISGEAAHNREVMALVQGQPAVRQAAAQQQQHAAGGQQQGGPSPGRGAGGSSAGGGAARRSPHSPSSGNHQPQQQHRQGRGSGAGSGSHPDDRVAVVLDL